MLLNIHNNRTEIIGSPEPLLNILYEELKHETPFSSANENGFIDPESLDTNWDGYIRFLRKPKTKPPWFPSGLLREVLEVALKNGVQPELNDKRNRPESGFPELVNIPLRDYQEKAVNLAEKKGYGVLEMPPRSGKTRTMMELHRRIALPTLWLAPTSAIVEQTVNALEEFFGANYAIKLVGSTKEDLFRRYQIVVCTAATAVLLPQSFYDKVQMLSVDEFHHAAAKTYKKIVDKCSHVFHRYGMSGTFFRSGTDTMSMHALLSETIYKVTSSELEEMGYLVPSKIVFLKTKFPRLRNLPSQTFIGGWGKYGIHEHNGRNQLVAQCTLALHKAQKTVLILVGTKRQGYTIKRILEHFFPSLDGAYQHSTVEFVSTDMPRAVQKSVIQSFSEYQEVKVLIGTTILGEGVDLPSADALVYAKGEKAAVSLCQSAYRTSTAVEGKTHAIIVDFADKHNAKLHKHAKERLQIYFDEPIFSIDILENPEDFGNWLEKNK